jgi:hypothetical protein
MEYAVIALAVAVMVALVMQGRSVNRALALVEAHQREWGTAAEFITRCRDRSDKMQEKAVAAQIAKGPTGLTIQPRQEPPASREQAQLDRALMRNVDELDNM